MNLILHVFGNAHLELFLNWAHVLFYLFTVLLLWLLLLPLAKEWLGGLDLLSDVLDLRGITLNSLSVNLLLSTNQHLDQLEYGLAVVTLGQGLHGGLDQVEPLLEVVKANDTYTTSQSNQNEISNC